MVHMSACDRQRNRVRRHVLASDDVEQTRARVRVVEWGMEEISFVSLIFAASHSVISRVIWIYGCAALYDQAATHKS